MARLDDDVRISIRHARPRDARRLVELGAAVAAEREGMLVSDGGWWNVTTERAMIRRARSAGLGAVLVAELDGRIVGRVQAIRGDRPPSRHVAEIGIFVEEEARRRGVARRLLTAVEAWARAAGVEKLELHVFPRNAGAIALYAQAGYEREGLRRNHFVRAGVHEDAVLMAKLLP